MKIALHEISTEKRYLSFGSKENWQAVIADNHGVKDISFRSAPEVEIEIFRSGEEIFIRGFVKAVVSVTCVRCLTAYELPLDFEFRYNMFPGAGQSQQPEELELSQYDVEIGYYTDESIDFNPLVSEQIMIEIPHNPICRKNCAGLCSVCGADLNNGDCGCDRETKISPFAALKGFKVKK
jgi:DUF177 domain-containing protein